MPLARHFTTALAMLIAAAGPLAAQRAIGGDEQAPAAAAPILEQGPVAPPVSAPPVSLMPFAQDASVGVHALAPAGRAPIVPRRRERMDSNILMMIVGVAALTTGAVVLTSSGSDATHLVGGVVMFSGLVIGLVGLFGYAR
jgi:hypothetical protein